MSEEVKNNKVNDDKENLAKKLSDIVAGLTYPSESDAEIKVFRGQTADSVNIETLLLQIGKTKDIKVETKQFDDFFAPLIKIQKWYGEDERKMTEKFTQLKVLLQENLIQKKVFQLGKINIEIYVVGLDKDNILRGIQTHSVET